MIAIIVRQWNALDRLAALWADFLTAHRNSSIDFSLYVFDDGSNDGSQHEIEEAIPGAKVLRSKRRIEYCASLNRVAQVAISDGAKWLFFCNADCDGFSEAFLDQLVEFAEGNNMQWVSPSVSDFTGVSLTPLRRVSHFDVPFVVQTEAHLFDSETFSHLGGFNENLVRYGEDVELMHRFLACGYRAGTADTAHLRHEGSGLSSRQVFVRTHFKIRNALLLHSHLSPASASDRRRWIKGVLSAQQIGDAKPVSYAYILWVLGIATGLLSGALNPRRKSMFRSPRFLGMPMLRSVLLSLDYPLERFAHRQEATRLRDTG